MRAPRLLAISDDRIQPGAAWKAWCRELGAAGLDAIQVRQKSASDRIVLELANQAIVASSHPAREQHGAPERSRTQILVNRRLDLALAAGADGVHLPADGLPLPTLARFRGASGLGRLSVSVSTHSVDEVRCAAQFGADFVLYGPVFETPSKAGILEPRGLDGLAAAAAVGIPVLALGGIDASNLADAIAAGAWGIAAIRGLATPAAAREARERLAVALRSRP